MKLILAAALAGLVSLPAQGAPGVQGRAPAAQAPASAADGDPNERICRPSPSPTGSRLGATRICATRAQWRDTDINRAFARRNIETIQTQRLCRPNDCR